LLASQEGLCSTELISSILFVCFEILNRVTHGNITFMDKLFMSSMLNLIFCHQPHFITSWK